MTGTSVEVLVAITPAIEPLAAAQEAVVSVGKGIWVTGTAVAVMAMTPAAEALAAVECITGATAVDSVDTAVRGAIPPPLGVIPWCGN